MKLTIKRYVIIKFSRKIAHCRKTMITRTNNHQILINNKHSNKKGIDYKCRGKEVQLIREMEIQIVKKIDKIDTIKM